MNEFYKTWVKGYVPSDPMEWEEWEKTYGPSSNIPRSNTCQAVVDAIDANQLELFKMLRRSQHCAWNWMCYYEEAAAKIVELTERLNELEGGIVEKP